jgi:hypothetical protein
MKYIEKNSEPEILKRFREDTTLNEDEKKSYNALGSYRIDGGETAKRIIEKSLLDEQGHICAYCMKSLDKSMRIEHWYPQRSPINPEQGKILSTVYSNFLGVCLNYKHLDDPKIELHCEAKRGNTILTINPTDKGIMEKIAFTEKGFLLFKEDEIIQNDISITLNLNIELLKLERENIWKGVEKLIIIKSKTNSRIQVLKDLLHKYEIKKDGRFQPYCQVVIYFLKKAITKEESI